MKPLINVLGCCVFFVSTSIVDATRSNAGQDSYPVIDGYARHQQSLRMHDCFDTAGEHFGIDPVLLRAIAQVESHMNPAAINRNSNNSIDVGLMQINSIHFERLRKRGIDKQDLLTRPCVSIHVASDILAGFIRRHGYNWTAVGAYNAGSTDSRAVLRERYAEKVWRAYQGLQQHTTGSAEISTARWHCANCEARRRMTMAPAATQSALVKSARFDLWEHGQIQRVLAGMIALLSHDHAVQQTEYSVASERLLTPKLSSTHVVSTGFPTRFREWIQTGLGHVRI